MNRKRVPFPLENTAIAYQKHHCHILGHAFQQQCLSTGNVLVFLGCKGLNIDAQFKRLMLK